MGNKVEYKSLNEVHKAYPKWESEKKAWEFAQALWKTAEKLIKDEADNMTDYRDTHNVKLCKKFRDSGSLTLCLTDDFRRLVIRYHARGYSTTKAIEAILFDETMLDITPFYLFRQSRVCGKEGIKSFLVSRVSYLKPSHPRWPEKKFGDLWREERAAFVDEIKEIPLTHPNEQLTKLSEHYQELEELFKTANNTKDKETYHKCMMRTLAAIHAITRDTSVKVRLDAVTQENRNQQALQKPNKESIIDISTQDISTQTEKIERK